MSENQIAPPSPSNKLVETKDLLFVWRLILKNLGFLILLPILAYAVGYIYTYRLTNIYGAKAELLLKSNDTYDYQDPIYKGLGAYGVYMDVQNQIRILNSRDLVGEVVDKLDIATSYFIVGRIKKVEVFESIPFKSTFNVINPQIYEKPIAVSILDKDHYEVTYEINGKEFVYQYPFNEEVRNAEFSLRLDKRYGLNSDDVSGLQESEYEIVFHSRNYLISKFQSSLKVENIEHTSVLELMITDELRDRAVVYLDSMTHTYVNYSKRVQLEVNENTLNNIQKQIDTVRILIEEKEAALLAFRDENAILNVDKEGEDYFNEYISYSKDKRLLKQKENSILSLMEYLNSGEDARILPPSFYIEENDVYLRDAISTIRQKQVQYEVDRASMSADNPSMVNDLKELALLKSDVLAYLQNLNSAIKAEIELIDEYIAEYRSNIKKLPKSAQGVKNLTRELEVNNNMYVFLLEKKTNTLIARAGIIPQVRIIENTVSTGIVYPNRTQIIRLFVMGGLLLALFIAIIRKLFFERIESVTELAQYSEIPIAGGVPFLKNQDELLVTKAQPKSHFTESFRTIRTNLSFMNRGEEGKATKVLLSSFFPGEGKTFCSSNLSLLLANGNKRVLIMDFDLHRPKVHKMFDLKNEKGVSNYLIGKNEFDEIVHRGIHDNLDVITAGPIAPNPSELVLREEVKALITYAEENYDYVIIDTPPFGLLNDTMELLNYIDNFLVIMNARHTRKKGVDHINEVLGKYTNVGKGVVLNGIKENRFQYYYSKYTYKYNYGYNYGYGYGYGKSYGENYSNDIN